MSTPQLVDIGLQQNRSSLAGARTAQLSKNLLRSLVPLCVSRLSCVYTEHTHGIESARFLPEPTRVTAKNDHLSRGERAYDAAKLRSSLADLLAARPSARLQGARQVHLA